MHTTLKQQTGSWYDTPYGRLAEQAGHRKPQPSVAEVMCELSGSANVGLAWAVAMGGLTIPMLP